MNCIPGAIFDRPPSNYLQWLECFELLGTRRLSPADLDMLKNGTCSDIGSAVDYFEKELIKAVNRMINLCIKDFNRELNAYLSFNDNESCFEAYRRLKKRLDDCLFFTELDFISVMFRNELEGAVSAEIDKFWGVCIKSLYDQCIQNNDKDLEDLYYYIKRLSCKKL